MTKNNKNDGYFLSQVHQPFFTLGISNTLVMMLIFALSYKGLIHLTLESGFFHAYSLIFIVFTNIFTGFLFTTYPKYCGMPDIKKTYYLKVLYTNLLGTILFIIGAFFSLFVATLAMIILAIGHYLIVKKLNFLFTKSEAVQLEDPFWILRAFRLGFYANIMMILSVFIPFIHEFAIYFSFYMFLIFLTFSVGQRMIPFFSHSMEPKDENFVSAVFVLLFTKTLLSTFHNYEYVKIAEIIIDLLLGFYILGEFLNWKILDKNAHAIIWILHLGLFWLPTALFIDALTLSTELFLDTDFVYLGVHLIALGFLTTILIGFGTRVTYGHSKQAPHATNYDKALFFFTIFVVLMRFIYSLNLGFGWGLDFLFDISLSFWLLLFILWSAKFLPILIRGAKKT